MSSTVEDSHAPSNDDADSSAKWPEAMDLLNRTAVAFQIMAERDSRDPYPGLYARILSELHQAMLGCAPDLEPLDVAARVVALARKGRPASVVRDDEARRSDGKAVPPDDLDLIDRCLRLAFGFVWDADNVYEHRAPPATQPEARRAWRAWLKDLPARIDRAEKEPLQHKRLAFLYAVDMAARNEAIQRHEGRRGPPIEALMMRFMRPIDVYASRSITREQARRCVEAWQKTKGKRGPSLWQVLVEVCNELGLGGQEGITAQSLKSQFEAAVAAGRARKRAPFDAAAAAASIRSMVVKGNLPVS